MSHSNPCPCLLTVTITTAVTMPHTTAAILPMSMLDFLGLELSTHDAEVALHVIFEFLLVSVLGAFFVLHRLWKTKRKLKKAPVESVKMERM